MNKLLAGIVGGVAGTAAMTGAMEAMHARLPPGQKQPLPPRQITEVLLEKADATPSDPRVITALTVANHFGYGVGVAWPYTMIAPRSVAAGAAAGALYGMGVWVGSYLGWLPALGILRPATEHLGPRRNLMIAAHVVFGAAMGAAVALAGGDSQASGDRRPSAA